MVKQGCNYLAGCLALVLSGPCFAGAEELPEPLRPPEGYRQLQTVHAKGDQIYQCTLEQGQYAWKVSAPDATLYDDKGKVVGNHYAGPVWEYKAGSKVRGKVLAKVDKASEGAITWLLLEVIEHNGDGFLSGVSYINRINTQNGLPPATPCSGNNLGAEKRSPYQADYVFYGK